MTHDVCGYANGCRCPVCRAAWAAYHRQWRARVREKLAHGLIRVHHGTRSTYANYRCRCGPCRYANAASTARS